MSTIPEDRLKILKACTNGDEAAAQFLETIYTFFHMVDDLVDQDVTPAPTDEQIGKACVLLILTIGGNPFYQAHRQKFEALIEQAFSAWLCANNLERDKKTEGKVLKSWYHEIFWHTARITGGWDYMRRVCLEHRAFDMSMEEVPHGLLR